MSQGTGQFVDGPVQRGGVGRVRPVGLPALVLGSVDHIAGAPNRMVAKKEDIWRR
ncbi:hypothetical protein [Couchioplanes caeruleus]|uniref:hypothetical protein n=1 Tax=Couchioplanes caeruleus TaxID=56438 RepID=UPI000B0C41C8|nr:hypothetical protein [Couchioplanes caeruleus]